jgi:hypothetical protein
MMNFAYNSFLREFIFYSPKTQKKTAEKIFSKGYFVSKEKVYYKKYIKLNN